MITDETHVMMNNHGCVVQIGILHTLWLYSIVEDSRHSGCKRPMWTVDGEHLKIIKLLNLCILNG